MQISSLGRSDVKVSAIGFGAWGIGGITAGATSYGVTDDAVSRAALERAFERRISFFDTAPAYGDGHSEELIGEVFSGSKRDHVTIATKGGCNGFSQPFDFSVTALKQGLEKSLRRLRSDHVDLFQLHNPPAERMHDGDDLRRMAEDLKHSGAIRAFGVSARTPEDGLTAISTLAPDAIQVNFNLLDQRALDCGLFQATAAGGASIIARTPLCFGFLSGRVSSDTIFSKDDHRSRWSREQIEQWIAGGLKMAATLADVNGQSTTDNALRFCISFPEVATTIPGMLNPDEVEKNALAGDGPKFQQDVIQKIRSVCQGHSFFVSDDNKA